MKTLFLTTILVFLSHLNYAQSNTPCSLIPSLLFPGVTCLNTNGTTNGATYASNAANGGTPPCASPGAPDVWYSFIAPPGGAVIIQTTAGTITDGGMALYSGSCPNNFNLIQCDDDSGAGLMPQIYATSLTPGATYYIRFWKYGSGTGTFSICLTIPTPLEANTTCAAPSPICSGTPINFTANTGAPSAEQTNPGNNYGCLGTTPNPSWYYLEIANGGNLVIDISAGSDVDFAIWGPYPNLSQAVAGCDTYGTPQDCSYSTAAVEQVNLPSVNNSEVFILLVTNFANTIQNISVNNSGGTATTNCGILLLPVELSSWSVTNNNDQAQLSWITQSEENNDYFAVQRTADFGEWETIGLVKGAGTTTQTTEYEFVDSKPIDGSQYYRLLQVNTDGSYRYSDVISFSTSMPLKDLKIYPNPAKEVLNISGISSNDLEAVSISNLSGNTLVVPWAATANGIQLSIDAISQGMYVLKCVLKNGQHKTARFVVE